MKLSKLTHQKIKAIIFDLDGTLIDSDRDLKIIINKIRKKFFKDKKYLSINEIAKYSSLGGATLIKKTIGSKKKIDFLQVFRNYYLNNDVNINLLFSNIEEFLIYLKKKGLKIYICTNKPKILTQKIVNKTYLKNYITKFFCSDEYKIKKPDKKFLSKIKNELSLKDQEIIFIGDSVIDYKFCDKTLINFFLYLNKRLRYPKKIYLKLQKSNRILYNYKRFEVIKKLISPKKID